MTGITKAETIFGPFVGALDNAGVDWVHAVSVTTDGEPSMTGRKAGVVVKLKEEVHTANGGLGLWSFRFVIHKEVLCCKSLRMHHVMEVLVKAAKFICIRGLNHRQFDNLLNDDVSHGLLYHTEVKWLLPCIVLKWIFGTSRGNCKRYESKREACGTITVSRVGRGPHICSVYNRPYK